jgi:Domain of unknown function (DUF303).
MCSLKLPRLISDGMVLQRKKKIHIWGMDEPKRTVVVTFLGSEYTAEVNEEGEWEVFLDGLEAGDIYEMEIRDNAGNKRIVKNVAVGDVWICSGQSNMEYPMEKLKDKYSDDIENCDNKFVRTFKITEHSNFHGPQKELLTGQWKEASKENIFAFSAVAYYFAKRIYEKTGVPIGLIDASLGGSRIESWMGREMLAGYDDFLAAADKYRDDAFVHKQLENNQHQMEQWHSRLDDMDLGLKEKWEQSDIDTSSWKEMEVPCFFCDTALKGFIGSVWFRKEFTIPKELVGRKANLWLGTIVDSDTVYINGVRVGHTDYQYPHRKYVVPKGLLQEGTNVIAVRVNVETGQGRVTPGKAYELSDGEERISLAGIWKYRIGAKCGMSEASDFVNWNPTGLYNGMMAPCHRYTIAGILWYQGEANSRMAGNYSDLMERMIKGYRDKWGDETLPFIYVQLPNFKPELYDIDRDGNSGDWAMVRECQSKALSVPYTRMAVAIDLGEDNDLHPLNKKDIGFRLAGQALSMVYGDGDVCSGPSVIKIEIEKEQNGGHSFSRAVLICGNIAGGMYAYGAEKGDKIRDFELVDEKGGIHQAESEISENKVFLTSMEKLADVREIRYCYHNSNQGGLIYNGKGLPMSPFRIPIAGQAIGKEGDQVGWKAFVE